MQFLIIILFVSSAAILPSGTAQNCDAITKDSQRFDCFPENKNPSKDSCEARGCCWKSAADSNTAPGLKIATPLCFFPSDFPSYAVANATVTSYGFTATLQFTGNTTGFFRPNVIETLRLDIFHFPVSNFVRLKITDPSRPRYEVNETYPVVDETPRCSTSFPTSFNNNKIVIQDSKNRVLFSTDLTAPLIFADQFIQISTAINSNYAYGFGEVYDVFAKPTNTWRQYSLFALDQPPSLGANVYGVHPFGMFMRPDRSSYGMFLLNSNAMDVEITPYPAVTFRTIGGIIDLFFYPGEFPASVVQQHWGVVGMPIMPPYWALGFHLCRWGYNNQSNLEQVVYRNINAGIPFDVQWFDIDTYDEKRDWTVDPKNFPTLKNFVADLHNRDMHVVPIVDPAIQVLPGYKPYDTGLTQDIYIRDSGNVLIGAVWPGNTTFPDFTNPKVKDWWKADALDYYKNNVQFDGLWIDMNEPANFVHGSVFGCANSTYDNPPYVPQVINEGQGLKFKTICMSSDQYAGKHYNLHSLYGHHEAIVTNNIVREIIPGKRPFVLTRSNFAGTGRYAHHWTGDVTSDWDHLAASIPDILNFNLFGIPFVGADVCGFIFDTTEELCIRWTQLGSFYPFMRNHNGFGYLDQDPAAWPSTTQKIMRTALMDRYRMLPYYYTLHYFASKYGEIVIRPLYYNFPADEASYGIDYQFMVGDAVLVAPVVTKTTNSVEVYFPPATWYTPAGQRLPHSGSKAVIDAPIEKIPVFYRGGTIIPMQDPDVTAGKSRKNPFYLLVALDANSGIASGSLYLDDGESDKPVYSLIQFSATQTSIEAIILANDFKLASKGYSSTIGKIDVFGLNAPVMSVNMENQESLTFTYSNNVLMISTNLSVTEPLKINWSFSAAGTSGYCSLLIALSLLLTKVIN